MKELLLIDLNNILHRGFSVHEHLSFAGKSTGGLYGFVSQLATLLYNHPTRDVLICSDFPPYLRSEIYPEYKLLRKKQKDPDRQEKLHFNRLAVVKFVKMLGIQYWEEEGMEADDLIAAACEIYTDDYEQIVVASNDDDLYQLFKHGNIFFKSKKGNKRDGLYGFEDFKEEYPEITLRTWMRILMMAGTHNDVAGIRGIGFKTALKKIKNGEYRQFYKEHQEKLDLFHQVIKLPYHDNIKVPYPKYMTFNERKVMRFLAGYGIEYTGRMKQAFSILN